MLSNRLAFAALAVACVAAAAGGGYLATRQSVSPEPLAAATAPATASPAAFAAKPVEETEAVVGDTRRAVEPAPVEAASTTAPPRRERQAKPAPRPSPQPSQARVARTDRPAPAEPTIQTPPPVAPADPAPVVNAPPFEAATAPIENRAADAPAAPEPPEKALHELVVSADSVIGLQTDRTISSERAQVEDRVEARVVRDVRVGGETAIPAGSRAIGSVMLVERGGKFKERARLGIRFHTLVLADGTHVPMTTETIYRDGNARANSSAAKIGGGAVAGAILGGILGGAKGAAIGASTGAAGGTAAVAAGERSVAELPSGTEVTARILSPVAVAVER